MLNVVWWWTLQWTHGTPQITTLKMDTTPTSRGWYLFSHMPVLCLVKNFYHNLEANPSSCCLQCWNEHVYCSYLMFLCLWCMWNAGVKGHSLFYWTQELKFTIKWWFTLICTSILNKNILLVVLIVMVLAYQFANLYFNL